MYYSTNIVVMLITLDRTSGAPVFRQICEQIRFQIAAGTLVAGTPIPSTRELAADLAINPMTVSKAYALLENEGLLERRPGLPLVVRGATARRRDDRETQLERVLRPAVLAARQLGLSEMEAVEVYRHALANPELTPDVPSNARSEEDSDAQ